MASNLVYLLKPYSNNITKRAVKTPKLYFLDTGLAAYLTKWTSPDVSGTLYPHEIKKHADPQKSDVTA